MESLTDAEISVLADIFMEVESKLRHHEDGEMGWDGDEIGTFYGLSRLVWNQAKCRNLWWAR